MDFEAAPLYNKKDYGRQRQKNLGTFKSKHMLQK